MVETKKRERVEKEPPEVKVLDFSTRHLRRC